MNSLKITTKSTQELTQLQLIIRKLSLKAQEAENRNPNCEIERKNTKLNLKFLKFENENEINNEVERN